MGFNLHCGALSKPVGEQLREQGLSMEERDLSRIQRATESVTFLAIHGYLTESETEKARNRIVKEIGRKAVPQ